MDRQNKKELLTSYKERKIIGGVCAIKNTINGKMLVSAVVNLEGYKNRYEFSKSVGGCIHPKLKNDWEEYGADAFNFEVLEELEKSETQTEKEFGEDLKVLEEHFLEKVGVGKLY
jgi:hypothetical protein